MLFRSGIVTGDTRRATDQLVAIAVLAAASTGDFVTATLIPLAGGPQPAVLTLLFLAEALSGLGVMILDITAGSLMAAIIPHRMRARVSGMFRTVNYGIRPIGALLGGALGTAIGVRTTLWIAGAGALLGVLWLVGSPIIGMRTLPEPPA